MSMNKRIVYGAGTIFNSKHAALEHATTIAHWCYDCKAYKRCSESDPDRCAACGGSLAFPLIGTVRQMVAV